MPYLLRPLLLTAALTLGAIDVPAPDAANDTASAGAGCAACGSCGAFMAAIFILIVLLIVFDILIVVWVAKDARARGMDSSAVWALVVIFMHFIGLIVYLCARPPAALVFCPHCGLKRLEVLRECPHCGTRTDSED